MSDCAFCEIVDGASAPGCLYRDQSLVVLLDRESLGFGHCMVIPRQHVAKVYDLPEAVLRDFFAFAAESASRLERGLRVGAVGLVAFGSGFPHAHLHLIPHSDADVLMHPTRYAQQKTDEELAADVTALSGLVSLGS